jgi:hypothetical protein
MALFICLAFISVGCGGPETNVERTQYKNTEADFPAGKICVDSNVAAAPFTITDRDQIDVVTKVTYFCKVLEVGEYTVKFEEVKTFSGTPPAAENLELTDGLRIDVTGTYTQ